MKLLLLLLLLFSSNCFAGVTLSIHGNPYPLKGKLPLANYKIIPVTVFYKLKKVRSVEIIDVNAKNNLCGNQPASIAKFNVDPMLSDSFVSVRIILPCIDKTKVIQLRVRIAREAMAVQDYNFNIPISFPAHGSPAAVEYYQSTLRKEITESDIKILNREASIIAEAENPARILNGYEPRYTYYYPDIDYTINILSREIKPGKWTYDPDDPTKLIKPKKY